MTAVLLPNGKQQYFTTAGLPAVGYKVATFDAGTSNPRTTWQDAGKIAANTNPIILDARGEASVFWEGAYKVQLQDSTGAVIWTQDGLQSQPNGFSASLLPAVTNTIDLGSTILSWRNVYVGPNNAPVLDVNSGNIGYYKQTAAEIAAGITPLSLSYPEGVAFRYMTAVQIADVIAGTLLQDVTVPLQNAILVGAPVILPNGYYLVTQSINPTALRQFTLIGTPYKSQIINKASANKPTLVLTDCLYFYVSGVVIGGRSGFPNKGVLLNTAGGTHSGLGVFNDVVIQSNGIGIELQKCNTIQFNRVGYWPTNGIVPPGIANTQDVGQRKYAVFSDQTIAGNFSNEITFNACALNGVDNTIAGYASVSITAPAIGGSQVVRLIDCELESTPVFLGNIFNPEIDGCYLDRCTVTLNNCRFGSIKDSYNPRILSLIGCLSIAVENVVQGVVGDTFTIDNTCTNTALINCSLVGLADTGVNTTIIGTNLQGVVQPDKLNIGLWTTPAFAGGNFTANGAMTWTVTAPQLTTYKYTLNPGGKTMTVNWYITGSTVGGVVNNTLQIAIPAGKLANSRTVVPCFVLNNAIFTTGRAEIAVGGANISIFVTNAAPNYVAGVTDTYGQITFDIQ